MQRVYEKPYKKEVSKFSEAKTSLQLGTSFFVYAQCNHGKDELFDKGICDTKGLVGIKIVILE